MKRVDALLSDYGAHHRARGNLVCHIFGITLIAYGIVALLGRLPLGRGNAAEVLIVGVVLYYATLDLSLAAAMLGAFVTGWIFQAAGHAVYEKNRPAFFKNLVHLLVGPLFLVNEVLRVRRVAPLSR